MSFQSSRLPLRLLGSLAAALILAAFIHHLRIGPASAPPAPDSGVVVVPAAPSPAANPIAPTPMAAARAPVQGVGPLPMTAATPTAIEQIEAEAQAGSRALMAERAAARGASRSQAAID